jgi:chromate reductase, NAD(P)H dehydrogenase (quinone)
VKVLGISGSLRRDSYNMKLLRAAEELLPAVAGFEIWEDLKAVPPFDEDDEPGGEVVETLRDAVAEADVLLFATPEYNASIPGVLKNAVDWASRPRDDAALRGKTAAVAGASTGQYGALWAQQDLRRVLGIAGARVVKGELPVGRAQDVFDESGVLTSPLVAERLRDHLAELVREAAPLGVAA